MLVCATLPCLLPELVNAIRKMHIMVFHSLHRFALQRSLAVNQIQEGFGRGSKRTNAPCFLLISLPLLLRVHDSQVYELKTLRSIAQTSTTQAEEGTHCRGSV